MWNHLTLKKYLFCTLKKDLSIALFSKKVFVLHSKKGFRYLPETIYMIYEDKF